MNNLIKRIDERIDFWKEGEPSTSPIVQLLLDCRAEIELLMQSNQCLRDQNTALDEKLTAFEHADEPVVWWCETKYGDGFRYAQKFIDAHPDFPYPIIPNNEVNHDS